MDIWSFQRVEKPCHSEPVLTLAWESVLQNVLFLTEVHTKSLDFGDADCHVATLLAMTF